MIRIHDENGDLARVIASGEEDVAFFDTYGFVTDASLARREKMRTSSGVTPKPQDSRFKFQVSNKAGGLEMKALSQCKVEKTDTQKWKLHTKLGIYSVESIQPLTLLPFIIEEPKRNRVNSLIPALVGCLIVAAVVSILVFRSTSENETKAQDVPPEILPVVVQSFQPKIKVSEVEPKNQALDKKQKVQKALTQNLGFLKLMGRKDLKKAMGGLPTDVAHATPGAGPGGDAGSGGELLVGLGQGLHKTSVGNSGMSGLGGLGTKGAGGGAGGYGDTDMGSGAGRSISAIPLSQDSVVSGGLDRSLIQATILRYLSQVRACYEEGLKRKADMIGQVTMDFEISGRGTINYSRVQRSSLGDRDVESCISSRMTTWKFPLPRGGVNVKVSYPFMLRPVTS